MVINALKLLHYTQLKLKKQRFNDFRSEYFKCTREYHDLEEIQKEVPICDAYVVGSDQVWNPIKFDPVYGLPFAQERGIRTIGYAPSFGECSLDAEQERIMKPLLGKIDFLSCREEQGAKIISGLTGRECKNVLDPVLLQTKEEWAEVIGEPIIDNKYLLVYALRRRAHMEENIAKISKKTGLKTVLIVGENPAARGFIKADKVMWSAGPKEFLNLFYHAQAVCTNSFHGTAFSTIFQKPFFVFSHTREDYRAINLMNMLGLKDRIIQIGESPKRDIFDIDFKLSKKYYEERIKESKEYLTNALSL